MVLAKELATIDVLSGGRLDLGVGVGWQREEYEAAGLSYEGRGRLLDHTIEVCQLLWREQTAAYDGDGLTFDKIHMMPKPLQPGGVPVWVSGTVNGRAMERLAKFGSGWIPWGDDAEDITAGIAKMRAAVSAARPRPERPRCGREPHDGAQRRRRGRHGRDDGEGAGAWSTPGSPTSGSTPCRRAKRCGATAYLTELVSRFRAATS